METQQRIEDYFSHLGREMPRNNLKQAMVPENERLFPNENGTAPGLAVQKAGKCVILLPGPPRELVPMYRRSVRPFLEQFMESTIVSHNIRLFGIGESKLDELLGELTENENPTVALYAKRGEVLAQSLRLRRSPESTFMELTSTVWSRLSSASSSKRERRLPLQRVAPAG